MTRLLVLPLNRPPNEVISAERGLDDEADDSITMMCRDMVFAPILTRTHINDRCPVCLICAVIKVLYCHKTTFSHALCTLHDAAFDAVLLRAPASSSHTSFTPHRITRQTF
eukprot:scaffold10679_cov99-Skeletonema_dohrnii-CCMP3373.AAC.9